MREHLCAWILLWLIRRVRARKDWYCRKWSAQQTVTFEGLFLFWRMTPFARDEWISVRDGVRKVHHALPWWRPFNALLHQWMPVAGTREGWHDHPRWSITVCLRGGMVEHTPWGDNVLRPGSIVFRSRKYIHAFSIPPEHAGHTWTLFIVGRRNHRQNSYTVTPR